MKVITNIPLEVSAETQLLGQEDHSHRFLCTISFNSTGQSKERALGMGLLDILYYFYFYSFYSVKIISLSACYVSRIRHIKEVRQGPCPTHPASMTN